MSKEIFIKITSGTFRTNEYDKFFHLALRITLDTGKSFFIEKRPNISISSNFVITEYTENIDVPVVFNLDYDTLIENTEKYMGSSFNTYSIDNNCQSFILAILKANGLGNDLAYRFIKQDTEYLYKNNPKIKLFLNYIASLYIDFLGNRKTIKALR